jgi:hypothetical protein
MKKVTVTIYRKDKYYPRVVRAVSSVLSKSDVVAPVDVLIEMGNLPKRITMHGGKGKSPILSVFLKEIFPKLIVSRGSLVFMPMISIWFQALLIITNGAKAKNPLYGFLGHEIEKLKKPIQGIFVGINHLKRSREL